MPSKEVSESLGNLFKVSSCETKIGRRRSMAGRMSSNCSSTTSDEASTRDEARLGYVYGDPPKNWGNSEENVGK